MSDICLILHDIRSTHNVGSLLRTAEGLGVSKVFFTGYTPYPHTNGDTRLPHLSSKLSKQIHKTALGAEALIPWEVHEDVATVIHDLKTSGFSILGLEQTDKSVPLSSYSPAKKSALVLGREVEGIDRSILRLCDSVVEIPMRGQKESFNVVQAAAIALYVLLES